MNTAIQTVQGVQYATGSTSNHAGTTDEFMFFVHRIFGFDLECGRSFQPPPADAVMASLEVAEAAKALGVCATGVTGLPIQELIERRENLLLDGDLSAEEPQPLASGPWEVEDLEKERWRRFLVVCEALLNRPREEQYADLAKKGFDIISRLSGGPFEIVASAADLSALLQLGYRPLVAKDLLMEMDQGN